MPLFRKKESEPPAGSADPDAQVLAQLRASGVDLKAPLELRHYMYFAKEGEARRASLEFGDSPGWQVEVRPAAQGPDWLFVLTHRGVVDHASIQRLRASLTAVAARHGGQYDGWEAGAPS